MVNTLFIWILGLIAGSFLGALTYRFPRRISIKKGRSFCPNCLTPIKWFDNIPLFSYLLLGGKCRSCRKRISIRYPLIEGVSGLLFVFIYTYSCQTGNLTEISGLYRANLGLLYFPFIILIFSFLATIFVIDLENQIIPDEFIFFLLLFISFALFIFPGTSPFRHLASGFGASLFLLFIFLITKEKGMGLGDVKFALFAGTFLGWPQVLVWLFLSFLMGAVVGVFLILIKKASFGKHIPFGPFLVVSFFIATFFGDKIISWLGF